MANPLTSSILIALTLLSLAAWAAAILRLRRVGRRVGEKNAPKQSEAATTARWQQGLVGVIGGGAAGLFIYRWAFVHGRWQPLAAHVDGLLLIAAFFAFAIIFIQWRPRLFGLSAFALPLLSFILAWAICAAAWTYRPFNLRDLHPVWLAVHLGGVYLGTLSSAIAAIAGGMFLYVQTRLKRKSDLGAIGRLASLEALETLIIRAATLGFLLLTIGLGAGVVILSEEQASALLDGWYAGKIAMGGAAWLIYALLMNVRYATGFRGARAAWLAITGLVLLLGVYGVVSALPEPIQRPTSSVHRPASRGASPGAAGRDQRSEVRGQRSEIRGQRSEVRGRRSEGRGQRSVAKGRRSAVRGQRSEGDSSPKRPHHISHFSPLTLRPLAPRPSPLAPEGRFASPAKRPPSPLIAPRPSPLALHPSPQRGA